MQLSPGGGIGRRAGFRIQWALARAGSNPAPGTPDSPCPPAKAAGAGILGGIAGGILGGLMDNEED